MSFVCRDSDFIEEIANYRNAESLKDFLDNFVNRVVTATGQTILQRAALRGNVELVSALLSRGADPNACDDKGNAVLHLLCSRNHFDSHDIDYSEMVDRLLRHPSIDVNQRRLEGNQETPLALALASNVPLAMARALLRNGAHVTNLDKNQNTALHIAVQHCTAHTGSDNSDGIGIIEEILSHRDIEINQTNIHGSTALMTACHLCDGSDELVKYFLSKGARADLRGKRGNTALHEVCREHYYCECWNKVIRCKMIDALLENNPDIINYQNDKGETPLNLAIKTGFTKVALNLLRREYD